MSATKVNKVQAEDLSWKHVVLIFASVTLSTVWLLIAFATMVIFLGYYNET